MRTRTHPVRRPGRLAAVLTAPGLSATRPGRRPGLLGAVRAVPAWLLLGVLVVLYAAGMVVFALLVVLTALGRLVLGPPLRALSGLLGNRRRRAAGA